MTVQTNTNIATIEDFLSNLITFAVTHAGFANEGTLPMSASTGKPANTLHRISRTRNGITTYWGFDTINDINTNTTPNLQVRGKMFVSLPTTANYLFTGNASSIAQDEFTEMSAFDYQPPYTEGSTFYSDGNNVFAILEIRTGVFTMLSFGNVTKTDTWSGGEYLCGNSTRANTGSLSWLTIENDVTKLMFSDKPAGAGNSSENYMRFNDGITGSESFAIFGDTVAISGNTVNCVVGTYPMVAAHGNEGNPIFERMFDVLPSTATLTVPLLPIFIMRFTQQLASPTRFFWNILGTIDNVRSFNITDSQPKLLVNTDWRIYPALGAIGGTNVSNTISGKYGYAFKEIP